VKIRVSTAFVAVAVCSLILAGCSSEVASDSSGSTDSIVVDADALSDMEDSWIFKTKTKQNEVCDASNGGLNVDASVVDLYTLGKPTIYGTYEQVQTVVEIVLREKCQSVVPLQDARGSDAGAIAQAAWDRTVKYIGDASKVCELWTQNGFDTGIMFDAAPTAIEKAGFAPDDGKILEFVASYEMIVRGNCG
jgi:hypothetical protein